MRSEWIKARAGTPSPTQLFFARQGIVTPEMKHVAETEYLDQEFVREEVLKGRLIIPANRNHPNLAPMGIGVSTCCKVNANIGNSSLQSDKQGEFEKLTHSIRYGADTVMDLSTGHGINQIREHLIENCTVPLGTVPVYQVFQEAGSAKAISIDTILRVVEYQARQGVDYMTVHCGLLREFIPMAQKRVCGIVSRGGSIMAKWMSETGKENPFYEHFDDLLEICRKYDVSLSLGDGLRPGSLADASDEAQFAELAVLGQLTKRAWAKDVQVMIEGPGHIPFDQIQMNMEKEIELCHEAPFYVLGPVVTDIAPGYDHITSAIGATMAAFHGASMLCYVTPKEHLGLPDAEDVRQGLIAYKIAAHAADVARKRPKARVRDDEMAKARYAFDWEKQYSLSLDPERAREYRETTLSKEERDSDFCSMCGPDYCAMRMTKEMKV
ncbi:MAG: phosphomethylpyrimidine synthase ThiC [Nitrospinota bacterium]